MNTDQVHTGRGYWLAWFLASILGFGIGAILGVGSAIRFFDGDPFGTAGNITVGTVMGITGGYMQWFVLRERITGAGSWLLASALGLGAAMGAMIMLDIAENNALAGIVILGCVYGTVSGILQWAILHRKVARAGWWLPANILGSLVGAMSMPIAVALGESGNWGLAVLTYGLVFGAGNGAITGAALVWLLRQSSSNDVERLVTAH